MGCLSVDGLSITLHWFVRSYRIGNHLTQLYITIMGSGTQWILNKCLSTLTDNTGTMLRTSHTLFNPYNNFERYTVIVI